MSPLSDDRPDLEPGEAIRECVGELGKLHSDYARAPGVRHAGAPGVRREGSGRDPASVPALTCGYTTVISRREILINALSVSANMR